MNFSSWKNPTICFLFYFLFLRVLSCSHIVPLLIRFCLPKLVKSHWGFKMEYVRSSVLFGFNFILVRTNCLATQIFYFVFAFLQLKSTLVSLGRLCSFGQQLCGSLSDFLVDVSPFICSAGVSGFHGAWSNFSSEWVGYKNSSTAGLPLGYTSWEHCGRSPHEWNGWLQEPI